MKSPHWAPHGSFINQFTNDADPDFVAPVAAAVFDVCSQRCHHDSVVLSVDHDVCSSPESKRPVSLNVSPWMTAVVPHDQFRGERADKN